MDVRSAQDNVPVVEHNGTGPVWWLVSPRELQEVTPRRIPRACQRMGDRRRRKGDAHSHPTHEFYYILGGRGIMQIGDEQREVAQGDLVHIPPDESPQHLARIAKRTATRIAFAIGIDGADPVDYTHHKPGGVPR